MKAEVISVFDEAEKLVAEGLRRKRNCEIDLMVQEMEDAMKKTLKLGHVKLIDILRVENWRNPRGEATDSNEQFHNFVIFWIEEQSHRGREFAEHGDYFYATNGVQIGSVSYPALDVRGSLLHVWGDGIEDDNRRLLCTLDKWERIDVARAEYEETEF